MSVASLGMYDHPAQKAANDALWEAVSGALRADGIDAPAGLDRTQPVEAIWRDLNLLLAQACGLPLTQWFVRLAESDTAPVLADLKNRFPSEMSGFWEYAPLGLRELSAILA